METIKNIFYGVIMGIANVIPGVSGGTIAVIFGFYDRLLESITLNFKVIKKNLYFLIPLGLGVAIGIVGVSKIMKFLLEVYPVQTYMAFIGVIIGSLPLILAKAKQEKAIKSNGYLFFTLALGVMLVLTFINADKETAKELIRYTSLNLESFIVCFIAMAIATVTMLIPGVSGSLILVIMGMYGTIYGYAVAEMNIPLLIPIGLGAVTSLLIGAKVVRELLRRHQQVTYMAILGLLVGSVVQLIVISGVSVSLTMEFVISVLIAVACGGLVYVSSRKEIKQSKKG
ncbi:MAG: DUF368 domain-containing protein [Anaerorhabdus sp.]